MEHVSYTSHGTCQQYPLASTFSTLYFCKSVPFHLCQLASAWLQSFCSISNFVICFRYFVYFRWISRFQFQFPGITHCCAFFLSKILLYCSFCSAFLACSLLSVNLFQILHTIGHLQPVVNRLSQLGHRYLDLSHFLPLEVNTFDMDSRKSKKPRPARLRITRPNFQRSNVRCNACFCGTRSLYSSMIQEKYSVFKACSELQIFGHAKEILVSLG